MTGQSRARWNHPKSWDWAAVDPRKWKQWSSTRRVAAGMVGIAGAGAITFALGLAQAWMPNVVVGALTVAVTVTVVEKALRDEDEARGRKRDEPIMSVIRNRLDAQMITFIYAMLSDYSTTHLHSDTPIPGTLAELCDLWLDGSEDTPRPVRPVGAYSYLLDEARMLSQHLNNVRMQYAFVVEGSPELVSAIERLSEWVAIASSSIQMEKSTAGVRLSPQQEYGFLVRVVEATRSLLAALKTAANYEAYVSDSQREAAEEWNQTGRQIAAQRATQGSTNPGPVDLGA